MWVGEKMRNDAKLPNGRMHMQGRLGRKWWNRKNSPTGSFWEASRMVKK